MQRVADDTSIVFLDDRHYPLVITTWIGPATVATAKAFVEWHDQQHTRARADGRCIYSISDAELSGRPSPEVRRIFAEDVKARAERVKETGRDPDEVELSAVVITNPLLRGALTAIGWVAPSMKNLHSAATMRDALEHMLARMRDDGLPPPKGLDPLTYESPALQDADARKLAGMQSAG